MTKLKEFKENNPHFSESLIDYLSSLDISKTNKYVPMMLKVLKENVRDRYDEHSIYDLKHELKMYLQKFLNKDIDSMESHEVINEYVRFRTFGHYFYENDYELLHNFMELDSQGYLKGVDVNQINRREDINNFITLAMLKKVKNDYSKQVVKVFEDDKWLLIRPLTWEASKKYGSSTRWCTTSSSNPDHFFRYTERGVVLYCINLKTGYKVAYFKDVTYTGKGAPEMSFWNDNDDRVDSIQTELDGYILDIIRAIENKSNKELSNGLWDEEYKKVSDRFEIKNCLTEPMEESMDMMSDEMYGEESPEGPVIYNNEVEIPEMEMELPLPEPTREMGMVYRDHMDNRPYREIANEVAAIRRG